MILRGSFVTAALLAAATWLPGPAIADDVPAPAPTVIGTLSDAARAISRCWRPPPGFTGFERLEITVRLGLRRDGTLLGDPQITFLNLDISPEARQKLADAARLAVRRCTPLPVSAAFGGAFAGRPFSIRLIANGPTGQGA